MGHLSPCTPCLRQWGRRHPSACCAAGGSPRGLTSGWLFGSYCQLFCWCCSGPVPPRSDSTAAWAPWSLAGRGKPSLWRTRAGRRGQGARSWRRRSFWHFSCLDWTFRPETADCEWTSQTQPAGRKHLMSLFIRCESTKPSTDDKIWAYSYETNIETCRFTKYLSMKKYKELPSNTFSICHLPQLFLSDGGGRKYWYGNT